MRILFSSTWGVGHVFPLVPLARAFVAHGHDVRWMAHEPACAPVAAAGLTVQHGGFDTAGVRAVLARMRTETAGLPGDDHARYVFPHMFGLAATPAMVPDLLSLVQEWEPDLMVHEPAELAAPLVATITGTPSVTHSWGPPIPAPILSAAESALAPLWAEHGLEVAPFAGMFKDGYLDLCPPSMRLISSAHITSPVSSLQPEAYAGEEAPVELEDDPRPLLYVTLGTVVADPVVQQAAIDAALDCGARVIVTVGPQGDPNALTVRDPKRVRVERWIPQTQVLQRAALLVSHGGAGSMLGALRVGIPQLCLPHAADQFRNADLVVTRGVGAKLAPQEATHASLSTTIGALLTEPDFTAAAREVSAEIAAMPTPANVAGQLTDLVV